MNRLISLIALALLAPACDDGTTGIALDFEPATEGAALTLATDFEVNRLEALVSELKMLPDKDPAKEAENTKFKAKGSFFVNALDPDDSTIPPVPLPADTYKKVEWKFEKPKDGAGLDGGDTALLLDAVIDGVAVEVRIKTMDKVTLRYESGLALASGKTSTFLVDLDVQGWFDGVDVTALDADTDGVVIIDDKTNKSAYDAVVSNLKATIKLMRKP